MFKNLIEEILPRFIEDLLEQMLRVSEHFERLSEFFSKDIPIFIEKLLIQPTVIAWKALTENPATLVHLLLAIVVAVAVLTLVIGMVLGLHLTLDSAVKRHAAVFISYQHDQEQLADVIVGEMAKSRFNPIKLPFAEKPDHDTLLDQVKDGIRKCDVFICLPGNAPSFVESEVSMAFGLEKALIFVVNEAEKSRLPNTAKRGYPVFDFERLQERGFRIVVDFCSYLAGDASSTVRLYKAVFVHVRRCVGLGVAICLISFVLFLSLFGDNVHLDFISIHPWIPTFVQPFLSDVVCLSVVAACVMLFLVSYWLFFLSRLLFRTRIRRAILRKKFSDSFLPKTLDYSLTRLDLLNVFYRGAVLAEHESLVEER